MYSYSCRKPDGPNQATLPPDDSIPPGAQATTVKPNPSFLSRMKKQLANDSMLAQQSAHGKAEPETSRQSASLKDHLPMIHSEPGNIRAATNKPQYYNWRAAASIGLDDVKHTKVTHQQLGTAGQGSSGPTTILPFQQKAGEAEAQCQLHVVPQRIHFGREDGNPVPDRGVRHPGVLRGEGLSCYDGAPSNYKVTSGAAAPYTSSVEAIPRHMPDTEAAILEEIKNYYCEKGGQLHERVTGSLGQHHGELVERLSQVSLDNDKFLQRLNSLDATLRQPFAETRTYREGVEDSSVTINEAVEAHRRETEEFAQFLETNSKMWDAAKVAEDGALTQMVKHLENPDRKGHHSAEVKRIERKAKKLDEKAREDLGELENEFEMGKAELDREISKRFWG